MTDPEVVEVEAVLMGNEIRCACGCGWVIEVGHVAYRCAKHVLADASLYASVECLRKEYFMTVESVEEDLRKLAERQGHPGLVSVESVAYKLDLRDKLAAAYESVNVDLLEELRKEREAFVQLDKCVAAARVDLVDQGRDSINRLGALQKELADVYQRNRDLITEINARSAERREERSGYIQRRLYLQDRVWRLRAALQQVVIAWNGCSTSTRDMVANIKAALNLDDQVSKEFEEKEEAAKEGAL